MYLVVLSNDKHDVQAVRNSNLNRECSKVTIAAHSEMCCTFGNFRRSVGSYCFRSPHGVYALSVVIGRESNELRFNPLTLNALAYGSNFKRLTIEASGCNNPKHLLFQRLSGGERPDRTNVIVIGMKTMPNWYAVYTKPRQEAVAETHLRQQEFEIYLPKISLPRRRRGKWVEVIEPFFPRYLFIRLDLVNDNIAPIRSTPGISGLVRFGERLAEAPAALVETLMQSADATTGIHLVGKDVFYAGMEVMVTEGPFAGLSGIFHATKGEERVIILLDLLGRVNRTTVKRDFIVPA